MKKALAVLALLAVAALAAFAPPKPKPVVGLTLTASRVATSLIIKGCWTSGGGGTASFGDSLKVTGGAAQTHTLGLVTCDSFTIPAPAPAGTVAGSFVVFARNARGLASAPKAQAWTYTEPDVPPPAPVVDSVIVKPAAFTVLPGGTQKMCAIFHLTNGRYQLSNIDTPTGIRQDTMPACQQVLAAHIAGL